MRGRYIRHPGKLQTPWLTARAITIKAVGPWKSLTGSQGHGLLQDSTCTFKSQRHAGRGNAPLLRSTHGKRLVVRRTRGHVVAPANQNRRVLCTGIVVNPRNENISAYESPTNSSKTMHMQIKQMTAAVTTRMHVAVSSRRVYPNNINQCSIPIPPRHFLPRNAQCVT